MTPVAPQWLAQVNEKSRRLRELVRAPEVLVMPGAHDAFCARLYQSMGFQAVQCSSGAIAAAWGYGDGEKMSRSEMAEASSRIARAVSIPVNADAERGYGDVHTVGETVRALVEAGCVGMNMEDSLAFTPNRPWGLAPVSGQVEKIEAVLTAKRSLGSEFFLNARVDALMVMRDEPKEALREAVARGQAYAEAGADCIFFMMATAREVIQTLVKEVHAPVSVLARRETPPLAELQELGVARVSYGYDFALAAAGAIKRLAQEVQESGTITSLKDAMPMSEFLRLTT
jgi:2-methylisocitrate lyase-like PEP mutase family enzyme